MDIRAWERITNPAPVTTNPVTLNDLSSFLDASLRPHILTSPITTIYVSSSGSDTTGTGAVGAPFATIKRALQRIAYANLSNVTIQLADAGPFALPAMNPLWNFVTLVGTETIEDTRTISSVTSTTAGKEVVFVVSGATLADDAWRDRHLSLTGVLSNARGFVVERNVGNTIYAKMYNRTFTSDVQTSPAGGTVNLLSFSEVQAPTSTAFTSSFQANIQKCKITGSTSTIFCQATDKVEFRYCQIEVAQLNAGRAGGIYAISCSIANYGTANGVIQGRNRADVRLGYGTVVSDRNCAANQCFLQFREGSFFVREGLVGLRGLDANGIKFDGGNAQIIPASATVTGHLWFDDYAASAAASSCSGAIKINTDQISNGGFYSFGQIKGKVNAAYSITSSIDAHVLASASSDLLDTTGTFTTSADNGATASTTNADGTLINIL